MIPVSTFLTTLTGKAAVGVAAATMSVGAAAAAGADVPGLSAAPADEADEADEASTEEVSGEVSGEVSKVKEDVSEGSTGDVGVAGEQGAVGDLGVAGEQDDAVGRLVGDGLSVDVARADGPDPGSQAAGANHGEIVSTFTQKTDLEGCQKGQATAAVARGDLDPASDTLAADLAPFILRCRDGEGTPADVDTPAGADEEAPDEATGPGWKDLRDVAKEEFRVARDEFVARCGDDVADDDDRDDDDRADGADGDAGADRSDDATGSDIGLSDECRALKDEVKRIHAEGKATWNQARDDTRVERKAEGVERKAERGERKTDRDERKAEGVERKTDRVERKADRVETNESRRERRVADGGGRATGGAKAKARNG